MSTHLGFHTLLAFAESIANHSSGNLHGSYSAEIEAARRAVKLAGGKLKEIGRYRAGESEPMSHADYSRRKDERKAERIYQALLLGSIRCISDDIYDINTKRLCTHTELEYGLGALLKKQGHKLKRHGVAPHNWWTLDT